MCCPFGNHHMIYIQLSSRHQLTSLLCCIYASVNRVSIDSDSGLTHIRHQTIIWTNDGLLSFGTNFSKIVIKIQNFMMGWGGGVGWGGGGVWGGGGGGGGGGGQLKTVSRVWRRLHWSILLPKICTQLTSQFLYPHPLGLLHCIWLSSKVKVHR